MHPHWVRGNLKIYPRSVIMLEDIIIIDCDVDFFCMCNEPLNIYFIIHSQEIPRRFLQMTQIKQFQGSKYSTNIDPPG